MSTASLPTVSVEHVSERMWLGTLWALLLALNILAYLPVMNATFVYEDTNGAGIGEVGPMRVHPLYTRALTRLSYRFDWFVGGKQHRPVAYHMTNLAIHLLNGALLGWIAVEFMSPFGAWLTAAFFLGMTLNVESVAYVAARTELLSLIFLLLACGLTIKCPAGGWTLLRTSGVVLASLAAMWAKESAICGLGLLWLCGEYTGRGPCFTWNIWHRYWLAILLLLSVLVAGASLLVWTVLAREYLPVVHSMYSPLRYAAVQATAFWRYLSMVLIPVGFTVDHDFEWVSPWVQYLSLAGFVWLWTVTLLSWMGRRDLVKAGIHYSSVGLFGVLWVLITVSLRFVMRIPEVLNEHQFYQATVGVSLILGALVTPLFTTRS